MARPTDYNEEIVSQTQDYIDSCNDETIQEVTGESEKFTSYKNKLKVKLPTIEGLALYLKIHKDTIYEWEKIHEEFSDVIALLRAKQAEALINNGLSGDYNSTIAKVLLSKHGYKEEVKTDTEHSGTVSFNGIQILKPDDSNPSIQT
jgi:hypothetical protein